MKSQHHIRKTSNKKRSNKKRSVGVKQHKSLKKHMDGGMITWLCRDCDGYHTTDESRRGLCPLLYREEPMTNKKNVNNKVRVTEKNGKHKKWMKEYYSEAARNGDCLYSCVFRTLRHKELLPSFADEDEFIQQLRNKTADLLTLEILKTNVKYIIESETTKGDETIPFTEKMANKLFANTSLKNYWDIYSKYTLEYNPFKGRFDDESFENELLNDVKKNIKIMGTYSTSLEISLINDWLYLNYTPAPFIEVLPIQGKVPEEWNIDYSGPGRGGGSDYINKIYIININLNNPNSDIGDHYNYFINREEEEKKERERRIEERERRIEEIKRLKKEKKKINEERERRIEEIKKLKEEEEKKKKEEIERRIKEIKRLKIKIKEENLKKQKALDEEKKKIEEERRIEEIKRLMEERRIEEIERLNEEKERKKEEMELNDLKKELKNLLNEEKSKDNKKIYEKIISINHQWINFLKPMLIQQINYMKLNEIMNTEIEKFGYEKELLKSKLKNVNNDIISKIESIYTKNFEKFKKIFRDEEKKMNEKNKKIRENNKKKLDRQYKK